MIRAEGYRQRLERELGLSFLEFNYQLIQAYDYLRLFEKYECRLQLGGDDQWGNILAGVDLIRRIKGERVHAGTVPLLTTASGAKMGKTAGNAVWIDANRTPPYEFYQYWINTDDRDVARFLACFTFLPMEEIHRLEALESEDIREAKKILAYEVTQLAHGKAEAETGRNTLESGVSSPLLHLAFPHLVWYTVEDSTSTVCEKVKEKRLISIAIPTGGIQSHLPLQN